MTNSADDAFEEMMAEERFKQAEDHAIIAWERGRVDGRAGMLFIDNPFRRDSISHEAWERGRQHEVARTVF